MSCAFKYATLSTRTGTCASVMPVSATTYMKPSLPRSTLQKRFFIAVPVFISAQSEQLVVMSVTMFVRLLVFVCQLLGLVLILTRHLSTTLHHLPHLSTTPLHLSTTVHPLPHLSTTLHHLLHLSSTLHHLLHLSSTPLHLSTTLPNSTLLFTIVLVLCTTALFVSKTRLLPCTLFGTHLIAPRRHLMTPTVLATTILTILLCLHSSCHRYVLDYQ